MTTTETQPTEPTTEADLDTTEEPTDLVEEPGVNSEIKAVVFPSASQAKASRTYDVLTDLASYVLTDDPACTCAALHQITKEIDAEPTTAFSSAEATWIKKLIDVLYEGVRLTEESSLGVDPPEEPEEPEPEDDREILDETP